MKILMLAPPGAGKGTQAELLAQHFRVTHIASGDLLRAEVQAHSGLGEEAREYLERGDLVPDRLVVAMVQERCITAAKQGGFVLDGFPRNLSQAHTAYETAQDNGLLILDAVVFLEVSGGELRRRMLARSEIEGRFDDNGMVIEHRMAVYTEQTEPLLAFYRAREILHRVDGEQAVDDVFADVVASLKSVAA